MWLNTTRDKQGLLQPHGPVIGWVSNNFLNWNHVQPENLVTMNENAPSSVWGTINNSKILAWDGKLLWTSYQGLKGRRILIRGKKPTRLHFASHIMTWKCHWPNEWQRKFVFLLRNALPPPPTHTAELSLTQAIKHLWISSSSYQWQKHLFHYLLTLNSMENSTSEKSNLNLVDKVFFRKMCNIYQAGHELGKRLSWNQQVPALICE